MGFEARSSTGLCSAEACQEGKEAHLARTEEKAGIWQTETSDYSVSVATVLGPMQWIQGPLVGNDIVFRA
jgi:hypothetical protein